MAPPLWLIPALPFAAFAVLIIVGARLPRAAVAVLGTVAAASFVVTVAGGFAPRAETFYEWIPTGAAPITMGLRLDPLSLVMCVVVTFVGFLILLYSVRFMRDDDGYARFFAFMNLFLGSMLTLVLADNLVLLYLGWEGVGLCSYLLIGFWYRDLKNARAAFKAFLVTRIGDVALLVGILLIFAHLHTLNIERVLQQAAIAWPFGSVLATAAAALILGGAVGKSAQLPLQTWLPDAMAGPTPVSALIHAATMVTAGVYLIARMMPLFALAGEVMFLVGVIGAATLLLAACSALAQRDLKRILAYSTMSQVGYMFLALGVGAWPVAIFHLFTHAFFKSLLFLGAGVVIMSLDEEHDIFRMGGLRRQLPLAFWSLLIGAASLSALPFVTAGYYSKDAILTATWAAGAGGFYWAGLLGAVLTSLYAFRLVFVVFFGEQKREPSRESHPLMTIPLVVLSALALVAGLFPLLDRLVPVPGDLGTSLLGVLLPVFASLLGIAIAAALYLRPPPALAPSLDALRRFWLAGWGFDWLYDRLFVRPYVALARANRDDVIDLWPRAFAAATVTLHRLLSATQTGHIRGYVAALVVGAILLLLAVVWR